MYDAEGREDRGQRETGGRLYGTDSDDIFS